MPDSHTSTRSWRRWGSRLGREPQVVAPWESVISAPAPGYWQWASLLDKVTPPVTRATEQIKTSGSALGPGPGPASPC